MQKASIKAKLESLLETVGALPEPLSRPLLVVMVGLPGTGKTYFCRYLCQRFPMAVLESDALRETMFETCRYTQSENRQLFGACHQLIDDLLARNIPVALDATNVLEANRRVLYDIAEKNGAKLVLIRMTAQRSVVRKRLKDGLAQNSRGRSRADWAVYKRMARSEEPIARQHYKVDSSRGSGTAFDVIVSELVEWRDSITVAK